MKFHHLPRSTMITLSVFIGVMFAFFSVVFFGSGLQNLKRRPAQALLAMTLGVFILGLGIWAVILFLK